MGREAGRVCWKFIERFSRDCAALTIRLQNIKAVLCEGIMYNLALSIAVRRYFSKFLANGPIF